jgi:hypothetical protein
MPMMKLITMIDNASLSLHLPRYHHHTLIGGLEEKSCLIGGLQETTLRSALHIVATAEKGSRMHDRQCSYSVFSPDDWWDSNRQRRSNPSYEATIDKYRLPPTFVDKVYSRFDSSSPGGLLSS